MEITGYRPGTGPRSASVYFPPPRRAIWALRRDVMYGLDGCFWMSSS